MLLKQESWSLIQCEWTPYARFLSRRNSVPALVSTHNVESEIWARRARQEPNPIAKLFFRTQEWKMRWFERRVLRHVSAATAVTKSDVKTLRSWGVKSVTLVPNGVEPEAYSNSPEAGSEDEILFLASLDWYPNIDALDYFVRDMFPLLRSCWPNVKLMIVGRRPNESLKKRLSEVPSVNFVGEVKSVRAYLDRAAVVIVPLRIGGGSRLKILEALAAGKAVVSTSIGAEGLELVSGEHLIVADAPSDFVVSIKELLASRDARLHLGRRGRMLVSEKYGWDSIADRLEAAWHGVS